MDTLAKLIIAKREKEKEKEKESSNSGSTGDYDTKLNNLTQLINMILNLNKQNDKTTPLLANQSKLDLLLQKGVDIIDKDGEKFALIPVEENQNDHTTTQLPPPPTIKKKNKNKKKNKILCSYCHEPGHTRAHCEKRLYPTQF